MNVLRKLSPSYLPTTTEEEGTQFHREMILQTMLIIFCGLGLPAVVLAAVESLQESQYILAGLYGSIYIARKAM